MAQSSGKQSIGLFSYPPHTADLRRIYSAPTADMAKAELDALEKKWARKYVSIAPAWRRVWAEVIRSLTSIRRSGDPAIRRSGDPAIRRSGDP